MAMPDYKISYLDGTTQTLTTPGPKIQGEWLVFQDGSGIQLSVRANEVESVIRVGIPERTGQTPTPTDPN
jgi:hypothetical protein